MQKLNSSVHKAFAILEYFTVQKPEWGVIELAAAIGANKSTVYRFLADLQSLGVLSRNPETHRYTLGLKLYELGNRVPLKSAFVDKTHPQLATVAANVAETVHLAVLKDARVFYIDKAESPQGLRISSQIGSYSPLHATALGKILLAFESENHPEFVQKPLVEQTFIRYTINTIIDPESLIEDLQLVKEKGFAIDREEWEIGLTCVAVPVYNQKGQFVASLSASGPANRFKENDVEKYVATLKEGALQIKDKIGNLKIQAF